MSFNGKGFTIEGLFRSHFSKISGWTFKFFFAFELYYSLFHILKIQSSNLVDRALFNFFFNSFENSLIVHSLFWS